MSNNRWRLLFKKNNQYHRVCSFWGSSKDFTLYVKIYGDGKLYEVKPTITKNEQTINYSKIKLTDFAPNKISFHPTGIVHTTNNEGKRHRDGMRGIPFKDIKTYRQIAIMFPKNPIKYPSLPINKIGDNDVIIDHDNFFTKPFQIELYLMKNDNKLHSPPPIEGVFGIDIVCGDKEPLILLVRCKEILNAKSNHFPPQTYIGYNLSKKPSFYSTILYLIDLVRKFANSYFRARNV